MALNNFWGWTEEECVSNLRLANNPNAGVTNGFTDGKLTVDVYFPKPVPALPAELKGRTPHAGGRNRLMLAGHGEFTRDPQTPAG